MSNPSVRTSVPGTLSRDEGDLIPFIKQKEWCRIKSKDEEQLARIQKGLRVSRSEAQAILQSDKNIDKGGAADFDLPPEKLKAARSYTHAGTRKAPTAYRFDKKTRKKDATKEQIITELLGFLKDEASFQPEEIESPNPAKIITFRLGEQGYKIDLIATRKPK